MKKEINETPQNNLWDENSEEPVQDMEVLKRTFNNRDLRGTFIHSYQHFGIDGNDEFYHNFILTNIGETRQLQEDAIELSLVMNYYQPFFLDYVKKIIFSRRTSWIKLLCLDWLETFKETVAPDEYFLLNYHIVNKQKREVPEERYDYIVIAQACVNILVKKKDDAITHRLNAVVKIHGDDDAIRNRIRPLRLQQMGKRLADDFSAVENRQPVYDRAKLERIFGNAYLREEFIYLYSHFGKDGNDDFYHNFIVNNISKTGGLQENAIQLSRILNYYQPFFLEPVRKMFYSRRPKPIKVLYLDWLNKFRESIPLDDYLLLNYRFLNFHDKAIEKVCGGYINMASACINILLKKDDDAVASRLNAIVQLHGNSLDIIFRMKSLENSPLKNKIKI